MRATMSIPTAFSPVEWGDSLLIDGGILNNFPADVLKEMGADIIIGVNVGSQLLSRKGLNTLLDILEQTMVLTDYPKQKENFKLCDVIIQPELDGFTTTDFEKEYVKEIVKRGISAAAESKDKLIDFKNKYVYDPLHSIADGVANNKEPIISSIIFAGKTSYNLEYLYELIGHAPNDTLNIIKLQDKISEMKTSGLFSEVKYSIQLIGKGFVNFHFNLVEKKQPVIYGFSIIGNNNLHFDFILNLLGVRAGDPFDKIKLKEQIKYMVSLGYFEEVSYIIEPVRDNYLRLIITVKEKPLRKLRIGYRYDDRFKIVGIIGLQATNFPILGMREELMIQFAGLFKVEYFAFYPSRTLNFPLYPYIRTSFKDVPRDYFDFTTGEKIAEYNDKSFTFGAGFGHIFKKSGAIRIEYQQESMNISTAISNIGPKYFNSSKDMLRVIHADLAIDRLDDPIIPRSGFTVNALYDFSDKNIGSPLEYRHFEIDGNVYGTIAHKHTMGLSGFYTISTNDFPNYKWTFKGGSNSFVGVKIDQIIGDNFGYLRFDYRYEFKKDIFLKAIVNGALYNMNKQISDISADGPIVGYGFGIKFLTIVGPFDLVFSRGSKSIYKNKEMQNVVYFTAGFIF